MKLQAFVPLVTYPEANADAFATHAAAFASAIGAELHALAINADIPDVSNALSRLLLDTPELIRGAKATSRKRGEHLLSILAEKAAASGVEIKSAAMTAPFAALAEMAATLARYHDMSIVGWEAGNATCRSTAEAVVFGSGRPVALLPEQCDIRTFDHIAVAWDGSRVASRALGDARFLLERASQVSVITVTDEKPLKAEDVGERLVRGLSERGIKAELVSARTQGRAIAKTLQETATSKGCQLLVMGGYGHSRIRDFVLGGATAGIFASLSMPVLLSH